MFEDNRELINEFVIESREGLAEVESDLLALESDVASSDCETVNKVFRAVHSIKGAAGFMGLSVIGALSHSLENVLVMVRNGDMAPTAPRVSVMLDAADVLRSLIEDIDHSEGVDISHNVAQLTRVANGEELEETTTNAAAKSTHEQTDGTSEAADAPQAASEIPESFPRCRPDELPFEFDCSRLDQLSEAECVYVMQFNLLQDSEFARDVIDWSQRLGDTGTVLHGWIDTSVLPEVTADIPDSLPCITIVASVLSPEVFSRFWRLPQHGVFLLDRDAEPGQFVRRTADSPAVVDSESTSIEPVVTPAPKTESTPVAAPPAASAPQTTPAPASAESVPVTAPTPAAAAPSTPPTTGSPSTPGKTKDSVPQKAPAARSSDSSARPEANVRVSVSVLDRLMNQAGELVLGRNRLLQTIASGDQRRLEQVGAQIDQITSELQETIMQTRMQPVGNVFNRFTRIVRDLSGTLGKKCRLQIEGRDVELDKTIIEAIGDPLTHLVRNSVDHGVESPEARLQAGKPEEGTIDLRAWHQEGKVNISISDDGAGIEADRLRNKAVDKGLLSAEEASAMSDADALRLIFMPGFSTAEQVSAVSGRGVGMDVVRTNLEKIGGSIDIETVPGCGTTITVRLPLTLAILPSLIVATDGQKFAIPQTNISELVRVRPDDRTQTIQKIRDSEVLRLRGTLLPLIRLADVVNPEGGQSPDGDDTETLEPENQATNVIVLDCGLQQYGLVVDQLFDSEEIVVKPLGRHMEGLKLLAGGTVLGDGQIALILDIPGVASVVDLAQTESISDVTDESDTDDNHESISTLLFTNHPSEQFGVPMNSVARIERIKREQLDTVAGQIVLQYRGGTLPLITLDQCLTVTPQDEQDRVYVVVFRAGDQEVGLVAPEILDIRDIPAQLDTRTFSETGLLGSLIIDGRPTRIVDAYELARTEHPEWFGTQTERPVQAASQTTDPGHIPTVLLVEDSSFFRAKIAQFIDQLGAAVVTAEDGAIAWKLLTESDLDYDLIVSDIEMPNMNGFELVTRIRADERFKNSPVVALTSLASDDDRQAGKELGFDEYLIKLDRDQLALTVTSYLNGTHTTSPERQRVLETV